MNTLGNISIISMINHRNKKYTWKFQKLYGGIVRVCFSPNDKCVKVVPSGGNDAWEFDDAETKIQDHCLYFKWLTFDWYYSDHDIRFLS